MAEIDTHPPSPRVDTVRSQQTELDLTSRKRYGQPPWQTMQAEDTN